MSFGLTVILTPLICSTDQSNGAGEFNLLGVTVTLPESEKTATAKHSGPGASAQEGAEAALSALSSYLAEDMAACNRAIIERMDSPVALIPQLAAHLVAAGGKRLRPLLTLASARLCDYPAGPDHQRHVALAACVEFIHTATLLHDDVVDESQLRRGLASANAVFGNKASVLVGDFLFARSFQLMTDDGSLKVMAILSSASATIAEGEVLQMSTQNDLSTSVDQYLTVIHGKTAALFAAACRVGAVVAKRPDAEELALEAFGTNLGMAFQLVDDALDYAADQAVLGKTVGDDFREGKITLPVLAAYAAGSEEDRQFWRRVIEESEQAPEDLDHALALIAQTDAIGVTLDRAAAYARAAREALDIFPDTRLRRLLQDTASYTVSRAR
ncbi:polyprenyl synthetase family protein [Gluconacetobacter asukensis]|uniref:Octaprenyl diphosphate synthase n=2 Tax=Gluconacetobacter TaxID=89583 RepID=A0A7W4JGC6_9PROT|nr:polyprenyl synthetase family protein [Gluconacetobacter asukensis]MBB2180744.1 polyprenyl synthetase family protein [Gluconacetobacter tumulicola]